MARRGRYTLSTIIAIAAAFAANGAQWASYIVDIGAVAGVRVMLLRLRVPYPIDTRASSVALQLTTSLMTCIFPMPRIVYGESPLFESLSSPPPCPLPATDTYCVPQHPPYSYRLGRPPAPVAWSGITSLQHPSRGHTPVRPPRRHHGPHLRRANPRVHDEHRHSHCLHVRWGCLAHLCMFYSPCRSMTGSSA